MLVRGWAMSGITGIGFPVLGCYIGLITVIYGVPARAHLPAKEHHDADDERAAHDERRCQCHQIGAHTGLLPAREFVPVSALSWHCDSST
jgi:hypothetical protein